MLRAGLFVDLYRGRAPRSPRQRRELLHQAARGVLRLRANTLSTANTALAALEAHLEVDEASAICRGDQGRGRQLQRRRSPVGVGVAGLAGRTTQRAHRVGRRGSPAGSRRWCPQSISAWLVRISGLIARLTAGCSRGCRRAHAEQQGRWLLAHILDWHRREQKAVWWEYSGWRPCPPRTCSTSAPGCRD